MTSPINLNKARKARDRHEARKRADENAVKFGRTKAEKQLDQARAIKAQADMDGKKRET